MYMALCCSLDSTCPLATTVDGLPPGWILSVMTTFPIPLSVLLVIWGTVVGWTLIFVPHTGIGNSDGSDPLAGPWITFPLELSITSMVKLWLAPCDGSPATSLVRLWPKVWLAPPAESWMVLVKSWVNSSKYGAGTSGNFPLASLVHSPKCWTCSIESNASANKSGVSLNEFWLSSLENLVTVDQKIFVCRNFRLLNFRRVIFSSLSTPTKIKRTKNFNMTIADMCKRHTELNILVCCLSRVRKRTIYDGLEDHGRVSSTPAELSSLRHFGVVKFSALKNFRASNFRRCRPPTKYF